MVVVFKHTIIFKSIFENPYLPRADGWEIMFMYALHWKSFKTWIMIGRYIVIWDIHLFFIVISIGIIEFFQLVSILTFFLYTHILSCMYACISKSINFYWYLFLIHIHVLFVPTIFLYIRAQDIAKLENLNDYPILIDYF